MGGKSVFIHLLQDMWFISTFWLLWIMLMWTFTYTWVPVFNCFASSCLILKNKYLNQAYKSLCDLVPLFSSPAPSALLALFFGVLTPVWLLTVSVEGQLSYFCFCLSQVTLLWTFIYKFLWGHVLIFSFCGDICLGMELLGHMLIICWACSGIYVFCFFVLFLMYNYYVSYKYIMNSVIHNF